jgi:prepilin-type N-terminal cleavage/methylation domain-containing protein
LRRSGFTLVEICVVLAIIALVVTMAMVMLQSGVRLRNQAAAMTVLKELFQAQGVFFDTQQRYASLAELRTQGLIPGLSQDEKRGYRFQLEVEDSHSWHCAAVPQEYGKTGVASYYIDETGAIRTQDTGGGAFPDPADAAAWPLAQ